MKSKLTGGVQALLDHVPADKVELLEHATARAAEAAQHAGEVVAARLHDVAESAQELAHSARERAFEHAEAARERLSEGAAEARKVAVAKRDEFAEAAAHKRDELADTAAHRRDEFAEAAAHKREELMKAAAAKREELMGAAAHKREDLTKSASAAASALAASAADLKAKTLKQAQFDTPAVPSYHVSAEGVEIRESSSKWLWILVGVAVGALLVFLFAPSSGRRSRALVKDRVNKLKDEAVDAMTAASDKAAELRQRAENMGHKLEDKLHADSGSPTDAQLTERIKALRLVQELEYLEIMVEQGVVVLGGPALDEETRKSVEAAVRSVPGVKEVSSEFPQPATA